MNGKIDKFIIGAPEWAQKHLAALRLLMLNAGLQETVKWGGPVYVHKGNVVGLGAFKNFVSVWFFQGVFLSDPYGVLVSADDKTKALRQWRIRPDEHFNFDWMRQYVQEAILNDENGLKVAIRKAKPMEVPDVLLEALQSKPEWLQLFESMGTSHRNEYCAYVAEAKREETKLNRVQKVLDLISRKEGLNDKYKT